MTVADFLFHHLSGAIFGVGSFAAFLAHRWLKEATKSVAESQRFYDEAKAFYEKHAAERLAEAKRAAVESVERSK